RIHEFIKFLKSKRFTNIRSIKYVHLSAFVADYKSPSIHVKKARVWALKKLFHYLKLKDLIKDNISKQLPYPKIEQTVPHFLTLEEFNRILLYCTKQADSLLGLRNLIIIMMLGLLGLRTNSIISLNIQDLDVVAGLAWVKEKGSYERRIMVLPEILCVCLKNYIDKKRGPLFLSKRGKRISPRALQDIFRSAADSCGIHKHLHAHLFRHTAATHLNRVAGTTITQHVLGHRLRKNTMKYTHLNPDYYATYMKKHPFMKI
ncbi:MAG: tyrosine-type recombinase/integrase, partial [Desulfobacteraceae bacterium]|nr:tyrosine-type recombinase/integrase [Desulfobacteraceae bacterium]